MITHKKEITWTTDEKITFISYGIRKTGEQKGRGLKRFQMINAIMEKEIYAETKRLAHDRMMWRASIW